MFSHVIIFVLVMSLPNQKNQNSGFIHAVRVPRIYKTSAKIVETVVEGRGSLKQVFYSTAKIVSMILTLLGYNIILNFAEFERNVCVNYKND